MQPLEGSSYYWEQSEMHAFKTLKIKLHNPLTTINSDLLTTQLKPHFCSSLAPLRILYRDKTIGTPAHSLFLLKIKGIKEFIFFFVGATVSTAQILEHCCVDLVNSATRALLSQDVERSPHHLIHSELPTRPIQKYWMERHHSAAPQLLYLTHDWHNYMNKVLGHLLITLTGALMTSYSKSTI